MVDNTDQSSYDSFKAPSHLLYSPPHSGLGTRKTAVYYDEENMIEFPWSVRVYYEDTDSGGVVYHANYLKFMERARTEWLRSMGLQRLAEDFGLLFAVRSVNLNYHRPARLNDLLHIHSRIERVRGASLNFIQNITKANGPDELLCSGQVCVACVNAQTFKPRPIPQTVLTEIVGEH